MSTRRIVLRLVAPLVIAASVASPVGRASAQETKVSALKADAKAKPKDAAAAFALGRALRRAGRWAEAKTELTRAAALAKGDDAVRARYELAVLDWDQGKVNPALPQPPSLSLCKQVKVGTAGEALARVCAAEAWLTMARTAMAEDELAAAEKVDPKLYELALARAKLSIAKGAHDDARAKLAALTAATPGRAEGWLLLGRELRDAGKTTEAVTALRKARELDPDWPEASFELARALPDGVEARDLARAAVAMRATWPEAHLRLGQTELATGGHAAAKAAFETSIEQSPKVVAAHVGLAWALVKLAKLDAAKKSADDAVELSQSDPAARLVLGEALAGLGETDEAVDAFKLAHGLDNADPTGLVRAAEVLLAAKETMKAEAHAEAAVKAFPDDARAWVVKGDVELAQGDKKAAKEAYKKAVAASKGGVDKAALQKKLASL